MTEPRSGIPWRTAEIVDVIAESPSARSLVLRLPDWPGHAPGQHVDVRLTAEDGYQAQRSYSLASPPERGEVVLTVERIDDGEVSVYLTEEARAGDPLELRGPIGGYFVWTVEVPGPLQLIAGGSGVVPLMAMLRHRELRGRPAPARLLCSSRAREAILYREELERLASADATLGVVHTLTRETPPGWTGPTRRVDADMLREVAFPAIDQPQVYVCGPTPFVESVAADLVALGHAPGRIRTERFGPTGGQI